MGGSLETLNRNQQTPLQEAILSGHSQVIKKRKRKKEEERERKKEVWKEKEMGRKKELKKREMRIN